MLESAASTERASLLEVTGTLNFLMHRKLYSLYIMYTQNHKLSKHKLHFIIFAIVRACGVCYSVFSVCWCACIIVCSVCVGVHVL